MSLRADFQRHVCCFQELKKTTYDVLNEARMDTFPQSVIHISLFSWGFFFIVSPLFSLFGYTPQAVVDLLVMRELL